MVRYLSINELSERLGRPGQKRLMDYLIRQTNTDTIQVGRTVGVHPDCLPRLRSALRAWEERPRVVPTAS